MYIILDLPAKVRLKGSSCPLDKWKPIVDGIEYKGLTPQEWFLEITKQKDNT